MPQETTLADVKREMDAFGRGLLRDVTLLPERPCPLCGAMCLDIERWDHENSRLCWEKREPSL